MRTIKVYSFGQKHGSRPLVSNGQVLDCTSLPNPYGYPHLRDLDGRAPEVQAFVRRGRSFDDLCQLAVTTARSTGAVAMFCFGGRHRSVTVAEVVALHLRDLGYGAEVEHLAL